MIFFKYDIKQLWVSELETMIKLLEVELRERDEIENKEKSGK